MTTLLETASVPAIATAVPAIEAPASRKRRGWLPVLTVLFLISYGLMTMLIVEQGATIESQRALLRELYRDSEELSALRSKAMQEKTVADSQSHAASKSKTATQIPTPLTQTPSTQTPSTQAPASTAPSSQAAEQRRTKNQSEKQKPQFQMPTKPASDLIDDPRNLNVI